MVFTFKVSGMTCAACSSRVEKVASQVSGVDKVEVNLLAGSMRVWAGSDEVIQPIVAAVAAAGYGAEIPGQKQVNVRFDASSVKHMRNRIIASAVFLLILMYFTMGHMLRLPVPGWYHGNKNALVAALLAEYDVDEAVAKGAVSGFVAKLNDNGFLAD